MTNVHLCQMTLKYLEKYLTHSLPEQTMDGSSVEITETDHVQK